MPDDDLRTAFADVDAWAERHVELPGPARARRTARRRSTVAVAGATSLTVLAIVGSLIGVSRLDAGPDVSPAAVVPTSIPGDLEVGPPLSDDGETATRDVPQMLVDVCPGQGLPGVGTATDSRFRQTTGPELRTDDGLLVFADADAAVAFMSGLRDAADRCGDGTPRPEGGTREILQAPLPGSWAEGVALLLLNVPAAGGDPQPISGTVLLAARKGSAVALRYTDTGHLLYEQRPTAPPAGVVAIERRALDDLAPQLCRWTVAGC